MNKFYESYIEDTFESLVLRRMLEALNDKGLQGIKIETMFAMVMNKVSEKDEEYVVKTIESELETGGYLGDLSPFYKEICRFSMKTAISEYMTDQFSSNLSTILPSEL